MISKLFYRTVMLAMCLLSTAAFADVVVIVNPAVSVSGTQSEAADLFLGKATALGGVTLTPVDQQSGSPVRDEFYEKAAGKSPSQLNAHWSRIIFTGKGQPPKTLDNDAQVKEAVARDKSLIGYIDSSALDGSVKKIITVK